MPTGPGEAHPLLKEVGEAWRRNTLGTSRAVNSWVLGEPQDRMLFRIQSACRCRAVFGTAECDCDRQLRGALKRIEAEGRGAIITDPVGTTNDGGHGRIYQDVIAEMGLRHIRLLTNNPKKVKELGDISVTRVPHLPPIHPATLDNIRKQIDQGYLIRPDMIWLSEDPRGRGRPLVEPVRIECEEGPVTARGVEWQCRLLVSPASTHEPVAFVYGEVTDGAYVFVKSSCRECEALAASSCECEAKRDAAMDAIIKAGGGVYVHLRLEGRGFGMGPKLKALKAAREDGTTSTQTYKNLGLAVDKRDFRDAAMLLTDLGLARITLLDAPITKFGAAFHAFEVQELPLDYAIPIDARHYYDATVEHGLAFPKAHTRDELPTVRPSGLESLFKLRTMYVNDLERMVQQSARMREAIAAHAAAQFEAAAERISALCQSFVSSAPILAELARINGQHRRAAGGVGGPTDMSVSTQDRTMTLAQAVNQAIQDVHHTLSDVTAAIDIESEGVQAGLRSQEQKDRAELTEALQAITAREALRVAVDRDPHLDPRAVAAAHEQGATIMERFEASRTALLNRFETEQLPQTLAEHERTLRNTYRMLGRAFITATTADMTPGPLDGVSISLDPFDSDRRPTSLDTQEQGTWSPIFHNKSGKLALLRPFGRVPEPPELSARLDHDPLLGQWFYREHPFGGLFAPPPIAHDFHRLGNRWTYWAQRSVVGDPPVRVFVYGEPDENTLIRVHSACVLGEACKSDHCECGQQLEAAFEQIKANGSGVIIYLDQDGRGAGALAKAYAYRDKQQNDIETFDSYRQQGFPADPREYEDVRVVLQQLGLALKPLRILTNNPTKLIFDNMTRVPLEMPATVTSQSYLRTKAEFGHMMENLDMVQDPVSARRVSGADDYPRPQGRDWWRSQRLPVVPPRLA